MWLRQYASVPFLRENLYDVLALSDPFVSVRKENMFNLRISEILTARIINNPLYIT